MDLSVIIPVRNERSYIAANIENIERSLDIDHEIIVINDYSVDNTKEIVGKLAQERFRNIRVVDNMFAPGFADALRTGVGAARADRVVFLMGDSCDSIDTVKTMYRKISEGYDMVCGSRYMKDGSRIGGNRLKAFFSQFVGVTMHWLTRIPTRDISNNFKMFRRSALQAIEIESESFEIALEVSLKFFFQGYRITEVPTVWHELRRGTSNFHMSKVIWPYLRWYLWGIGMKIKLVGKHGFFCLLRLALRNRQAERQRFQG